MRWTVAVTVGAEFTVVRRGGEVDFAMEEYTWMGERTPGWRHERGDMSAAS